MEIYMDMEVVSPNRSPEPRPMAAESGHYEMLVAPRKPAPLPKPRILTPRVLPPVVGGDPGPPPPVVPRRTVALPPLQLQHKDVPPPVPALPAEYRSAAAAAPKEKGMPSMNMIDFGDDDDDTYAPMVAVSSKENSR